MLIELAEHYEQLEEARQTLIQQVRRLDALTLHHKPSPERWSILEDVQHLVLAEQKTFLEKGSPPAAEPGNPDMLAMVLHVLDQDIVVDVPDSAMVPDGDVELVDLIRDWDQARHRLHRFLESCGPDDLRTPVSRHTVAGPLTVVECLHLIASHFHHHRRRIEAAIERL